MASLLSMPQLWVGIGLLGAMAYVLSTRGHSKRMKSRLARVHRSRQKRTTELQQSLRRHRPGEASALGQRLAGISSLDKLRGRLEMAGMSITLQKLLFLVVALFLVMFFIVSVLFGKTLLISILCAGVVGLGLPHRWIKRKIRKRQLLFLKLFPEAIDLIVRGLRAGLPVAESFSTVAREIPPPVGDMFATVGHQMQLGIPMDKALVEAADKIDLTEFNFFVTTIILQRETGGNLGEILGNLSDTLRQRHMMKLKILALSSEARASAIIIGSLPFLVFTALTLVSPRYLDPFYNDARGNVAGLGALGIIAFGALIMRRMTQLEI